MERLAEERIREAMEQGEFDNLRGVGKPLRRIDDDFAGDDRLGLHVLRENGFLPEWLELRKQVADARPKVNEAFADWQELSRLTGPINAVRANRAGDRYRQLARTINLHIDTHNLRCPSIHLELVRFQEDMTL